MPTPDDAFAACVHLFRTGRLADADAACARLLDAEPRHAEALHLRGLIRFRAGAAAEAVDLIARAIAVDDANAGYHNNIGEAYRVLGRFDEALAAYQRAVALNDRFGEAFSNLGAVLKMFGRFEEALSCYRRALELNPNLALAHMHLGMALQALRRLDDAVACYREALSRDPGLVMAHINLASVRLARGRAGEAVTSLRAALALQPALALGWLHFGNGLRDLGLLDAGVAAYRRALVVDPRFAEARHNLALALERLVPPATFPLLNDGRRARAFDQAIRAALPADAVVLEIGTGSGLLAMMAARAGAAQVIACEGPFTTARAVRAVVDRNGLGGRVAVLARRSTDVAVGAGLPRRADLLVTDPLAGDLLSEAVLAALEDARRRLLAPGATIVPAAVTVRGMLVGEGGLGDFLGVGGVCGFDLSALNVFAPDRRPVPVAAAAVERLSEDVDVLTFDFQGNAYFPPVRRPMAVRAVRGGRCCGVLQWMRVRLHGDTVFENHPTDAAVTAGWQPLLHRFAEPVDVREGETVRLVAWHNRSHPLIQRDPEP